jgi:DNA repair photolyase
VAELNRAGIPTGVLIAPLMPGINDSPKQVEEILELCGEAGAVNIGGIPLHLRGEVRDIFFEWLRSYRPDLVPRYEQLYARGAYVGREERERIEALLRPGRKSSWAQRVRRTGADQDPVTMPAPRPPREAAQGRLF